MAMETIQTPSKEARNTLFDELRRSDDPNERQAVKYSEPVRQPDGSWATAYFVSYPAGQTKY